MPSRVGCAQPYGHFNPCGQVFACNPPLDAVRARREPGYAQPGTRVEPAGTTHAGRVASFPVLRPQHDDAASLITVLASKGDRRSLDNRIPAFPAATTDDSLRSANVSSHRNRCLPVPKVPPR